MAEEDERLPMKDVEKIIEILGKQKMFKSEVVTYDGAKHGELTPPHSSSLRALREWTQIKIEWGIYFNTSRALGFALRGNIEIQAQRENMENSQDQAVNWFKQYLD